MQYNFLLIDDEVQYCQALRTALEQYGLGEHQADIVVTDRQNWEDGQVLLEKNYYHALILDAKCMIDREQEEENFDFLPIALSRLKEIERKLDRHIPFVVNTGHIGEKQLEVIKRLVEIEHKSKIFSKTLNSKKDLLAFLMTEIENAPDTKIFKQYSNIFEIFELGFMPTNPIDFRQKLLKIFKNIDNSTQNTAILQDARVIQDEIYKVLQQPKINGLLRNFSFMEKNKFLSGNEDFVDNNDKRKGKQPTTTVYQTPALSYLASNINQICSAFGNHSTVPPKNIDVKYWEVPSNYAVKSVVFALLEQLLWFKELMKTL